MLNFCQCDDKQPCSRKTSLWNNRTHGTGIAEIDRVFPDYKRFNKWLKDNGGVYNIIYFKVIL